jgi:hypothetical protein
MIASASNEMRERERERREVLKGCEERSADVCSVEPA